MTAARAVHSGLAVFNDPDLGQTLIVDPAAGIDKIGRAMALIGLSPEPVEAARIGGEPTVAAWSFQGGRPFAVYSYNPVAKFRVLEVGTLPPSMRAELARQLPVLSAARLRDALRPVDSRETLRAIWGLVALERTDAAAALETLAETATGVVADEARRGAARLREIDRARIDVLGGLRMVAAAAPRVIARLSEPEGLAALLARPEDCDELFTEDVAEDVARHIAEHPFHIGRGVERGALGVRDVTAASGGLMRWHNPPSDGFPKGYRLVAGWLRPDRIWVAWKTRPAGGGSVSYDGLAFVGERWIFFPRPYRALAAVLPPMPGPDNEPAAR